MDETTAAAAKARFAAYTARRLAGAATTGRAPPPDHLGMRSRANTMTNMAPLPAQRRRWLHPASRLR